MLRIVTTLLLASSLTRAAVVWDDLRVTFSLNGQPSGYYQLPRSKSDAVAKGWTQPPEVKGHPYCILCPNRDPSVCVIYSNVSGNANGLHISVLRNNTNSPYDFTKHPTFLPCNRFGYQVYAVNLYTVKPAGVGATSQNKEGLWLEVGPNGAPWHEVPRQMNGRKKAGYVLQGCVPAMGTHYYYEMSKNLKCNDFEPVFGLYKNNEMIGFGVKVFGRPTHLSREWFETLPVEALQVTLPDAPPCFTDWTRQYGLISIHVWMVKQPWTLTCP